MFSEGSSVSHVRKKNVIRSSECMPRRLSWEHSCLDRLYIEHYKLRCQLIENETQFLFRQKGRSSEMTSVLMQFYFNIWYIAIPKQYELHISCIQARSFLLRFVIPHLYHFITKWVILEGISFFNVTGLFKKKRTVFTFSPFWLKL